MDTPKRLYEQSRRLAKLLLNHVELSMEGREIPYNYTSLELSGRNNFIAAVMMVNHEMDKRLGKDRNDCSTEEFQSVLDALDDILQILVRRVRKAKREYEKRQA
jgi:ribosome-associated translation inhibitor RaiA